MSPVHTLRSSSSLRLATVLLLAGFLAGCVTRPTPAYEAAGHNHGGGSEASHDHAHDHDHDHAHDHDHDHAHDHGAEHADLREVIAPGHDHARGPLLRTNLGCGWCDPYDHRHESVCGTPYVHAFLTEPAFLCTDIIAGVTRSEEETEVEVELEWAWSRRVGLIAELPWIDGDGERGIGDAALALRFLLVEERRFLLSFIGEMEIPTGSEARGLSEGHVAFAASAVTWHDLGAWFTLQTRVGIEHVPDEEESEFLWSASLIKSFCARPLIRNCGCGLADHRETVWSLHAEVEGATLLEGEEDAGETEGRWLVGATYPLAYDVDIRGAFSRTFGGDEEEEAWTLGFIVHF